MLIKERTITNININNNKRERETIETILQIEQTKYLMCFLSFICVFLVH